MNLDNLDNKIPQRWLLLFGYYLPFCKVYPLYIPSSNLYFQCRRFINELKNKGQKEISLLQLPDLVYLLKHYSIDETEQKLADEIISEILASESEKFTNDHLIALFKKFDPNDRKGHVFILNTVFHHIPSALYKQYLSSLNVQDCSLRDLNWCERLKNKFNFEDKLTFVLSFPDNKLITYQAIFLSLIFEECNEKFLNPSRIELSINTSLTDQLLDFIFLRNPYLLFPVPFIQAFLFQRLKNQDFKLISHILKLKLGEQLIFFENFLINSKNFKEITAYYFNLCVKELNTAYARIDYLIITVFSRHEEYEALEKEETLKLAQDNWSFFLLTQLEEYNHPFSLFQWFAIQALTKKTFDLNKLKKFFNPHTPLDYSANFSPAHLFFIAEYSILTIKTYIKENTRHTIHREFLKFFNNEYLDNPPDISKLILKKLPLNLQADAKPDLSRLQHLLSKFYLLIDDPNLVNYKNKQLLEKHRIKREDEEINEGRRDLLKRIQIGLQSSVSFQRMQELFGDHAQTIQEKWKKNLGVHFFDANDAKERKQALQDAANIIQFKREFDNDLSTLSISPAAMASSFK